MLDLGADVGLAFDGDADRVFLVDDAGQPVSGSTTTAIVAAGILDRHPGETIVHNLICSRARARGDPRARRRAGADAGRPLVHQAGDGRDRRDLRRRALRALLLPRQLARRQRLDRGAARARAALPRRRPALGAAQAVRALLAERRDQLARRRPARGDRAHRRGVRVDARRTASTGSPSTAATGGSTCGRATPSRCSASTSRRPTRRRATRTPPRCWLASGAELTSRATSQRCADERDASDRARSAVRCSEVDAAPTQRGMPGQVHAHGARPVRISLDARRFGARTRRDRDRGRASTAVAASPQWRIAPVVDAARVGARARTSRPPSPQALTASSDAAERVEVGTPRDRGERMVGRDDAQRRGRARASTRRSPRRAPAGYREADVGDAVEHERLDFVRVRVADGDARGVCGRARRARAARTRGANVECTAIDEAGRALALPHGLDGFVGERRAPLARTGAAARRRVSASAPRVVRSKTWVPTTRSRCRTRSLTAGWLTRSSSAARPKLPLPDDGEEHLEVPEVECHKQSL